MRQPSTALQNLLNKKEPRERLIAFMVPTRIIRIIGLYAIREASIIDDDNSTEFLCHTFRVEQLVEHSGFGGVDPKGAWRTLTTHNNPSDPGAALGEAFAHASKAQQDLIHKLRQRMAQEQQAKRTLQ